jgi:hypothetical protein
MPPVNLTHPGVDSRNNPAAASFIRHRLEGANAHNRKIRAECQTLGHTAGNAQPSERTRARAKCYSQQLGQLHPGFRKNLLDHWQ